MSSVAVAYFYHFLLHVAIVRLIAIKIFNRSAALVIIITRSITAAVENADRTTYRAATDRLSCN